MKLKKLREGRPPIELNLTSMIDVIFLLLIFFVCTSSFDEPEKNLPTNLAGQGIAQERQRPQEERDLEDIVVQISADPSSGVQYAIDGKEYASLGEVEETLDALREIDPNFPVVLDPDKSVPIESVLDVYDASRRVGLGKISFTASPSSLAL